MEELTFISFKNLPGKTRLLCDYLYNFEKLKEFYSCAPSSLQGINEILKRIDNSSYKREELVDILISQNKNFGASEAVIDKIPLLLNERTYTVFTGQQAGIFGGPLYTIYKAFTAVKLAEFLSKETGFIFLPVFWIDSEDSDFAEVNHFGYFDKDGDLQDLEYEPLADVHGKPVWAITLEEQVKGLISQLKEELMDTEFKDKVLGKLAECYTPGEAFSHAFAKWMTFLFSDYGLILLDPSDERLKKIGLSIYSKELDSGGETSSLLEIQGRKLESLGYHTQVKMLPSQLGLCYFKEKRQPLYRKNGGIKLKEGFELSEEDTFKILKEDLKNLSTNVVLRPVLQDYLFPNAAYVAGPNEVAYYAQFKAVYEDFSVPMPAIVPRRGFTILEKKIAKIIERFNVNIEDVFHPGEDWLNKILEKEFSGEPDESIKKIKEEIGKMLNNIEPSIKSFDPNLISTFESVKNKIDFNLGTLEKKIFQSNKKKNELLTSQLQKLKTALVPEGQLQERVIDIIYFLAKYGENFMKSLYDSINPQPPWDHLVVKL